MTYELDHPTTNTHDPLLLWACQLGPEASSVNAADHHPDCRGCVLLMGAVAVNQPSAWIDDDDCAPSTWYERYRATHGLPSLPMVAAS